jgi:uncharacterized protein (DUF4415 family)
MFDAHIMRIKWHDVFQRHLKDPRLEQPWRRRMCVVQPLMPIVSGTHRGRGRAAALSDPDALPFTDAQWAASKPKLRTGRPKVEATKECITIRISRDVVTQFRAMGEGWQTRIDSALRQYIAEHPITP